MDRFYLDQDYRHAMTTGFDEVGRGCIAGPVVTASLSWVPDSVMDKPFYNKLRDSKELSEKARESLFAEILSFASRVRIAVIKHMMVDQINVLRATLLGFEKTAPPFSEENFFFIDGNQKPPTMKWAKTLVKGENKLSAIAGASVLAKVVRDEMMKSYSAVFDVYGFEKNMGYPTPAHKKALEKWGPCWIHRKSFKPLHPFVQEISRNQGFLKGLKQVRNRKVFQEQWVSYQKHYFDFSPQDDAYIVSYFDRHGFL